MSDLRMVDYFFRRRWPDGFRCPGCHYTEFTLIRTRGLPLYQCRHCHRQTSVTSGTLMHKTRTPLAKWAAAIDALSASRGLNARELAEAIGVTPKIAWTMLRKFRAAIQEIEESRKLEGNVHVGLRALAPASIWIFLPHRHYRPERVVSVSASIGPTGRPSALKIQRVERSDLVPGFKEPTELGLRRILDRSVAPGVPWTWHGGWRKFPETLQACFQDVRRWLVTTFNGIGTKFLQSYLNEYCFRRNLAAEGADPREAWLQLCVRPQVGV